MEKISKQIMKKGELLFKTGKVKKEIETEKRIHFRVIGETEVHDVFFDKQKNVFECDCRYFSLNQRECSHIYAAKLKKG
jgi:hypothetical protein